MTQGATKALIRPLRADDRAAWETLWRDYLTFYQTTLPGQTYDIYFDRLMGNDPQDFHGLLAEVGGKPIGLTHYVFHRHGWKVENVCYLQDLYVSADMRGTGAGRALIEAVYAAADAAGAPGVYWLTHETNTTARQLYDRVGQYSRFVKYQRPA